MARFFVVLFPQSRKKIHVIHPRTWSTEAPAESPIFSTESFYKLSCHIGQLTNNLSIGLSEVAHLLIHFCSIGIDRIVPKRIRYALSSGTISKRIQNFGSSKNPVGSFYQVLLETRGESQSQDLESFFLQNSPLESILSPRIGHV